jgi:hypothetical protein
MHECDPLPVEKEVADHLALGAERFAGSRWCGMARPEHAFDELAALRTLPELVLIEDSAKFCRRYTL